MKTYDLIINPFAELDLQVSHEWYDLQKEGFGDEFIAEVDKTIIRIQQNPYQFSKVKKLARMAVVKRFPFGVFYIIKGNIINVFAIFHFSRNPMIWKKRRI